MTIDPATIAAYVDGELDADAARAVERAADADPALADAIARHRALTATLTAHYAPVLDDPVPSRLRDPIIADARIDTSLAARRTAKRARFTAVHWGAMAASLALGLTLGLRPWAPPHDVESRGGALVAAGGLARALDTQLASNQGADAAVRIGMSFRDRAGRYCRSFDSAELAGISCRDADTWRLDRTVPGHDASDYRQAGSGDLAAAASAMMAGEPLDAAAEKAARDAGWR